MGEHDDGGAGVGRNLRNGLLRPGDEDRAGARKSFRRREAGACVGHDGRPAEEPSGAAERFSGIDGPVDEEPRGRPVDVGEDGEAVVLERVASAGTDRCGPELRDPGRRVADGRPVLEDEELCAEIVTGDDREDDGAFAGLDDAA